MEHKIVLGGEQFLPFARSCVTKLKRLGLTYADQSYEIDGVSIKVRVEPGHEYIKIEGGKATFSMDSGVMDVLNIAPLNPDRYSPGILYEAGHAALYNSLFTVVHDGVRTNPNEGSGGQFSGKLTHKKDFKGAIGPQTSFAPTTYPVTDPPTPPNPTDDALWAKKYTAVMCPASVFTGRCRLYVQAMYGAPLHTYDASGNMKATVGAFTVVTGMDSAPALWIPAYRASPSEPADPNVLLDTNCGVYLDPATGKHWLFQIDYANIYIYQLRSNATGEKFRRYLVPTTGPTALSAQDRLHLETYILAYSRPDVKSMKVGIGANIGGRYSMGYGWHWNFSGTRADIVRNDTVAQDVTNFETRSYHYALTPVLVDGTWTTPITLVEEANWAVYRHAWTITHPDFTSGVLQKTTPKLSLPHPADAPFYAFYDGDVLRVCRVAVGYTEEVTGSVVEDKVFGVDRQSLGMNEGSLTVFGPTLAFYSCSITCGPVATGTLPYGFVKPIADRSVVRNKVNIGWNPGFGGGSYATRTFTVSDDFGVSYSSVTETSYIVDNEAAPTITFDLDTSTGRIETVGTCEIVVPFYDAEAIYVRSTKVQYTYTDSFRTDHLSHYGRTLSYLVKTTTANAELTVFNEYAYASVGDATLRNNILVSTEYTTVPTGTLDLGGTEQALAKGGAYGAVFPSVSEFHNNDTEVVSQSFITVSSSSSASPVVISTKLAANVGIIEATSAPVIVGWV